MNNRWPVQAAKARFRELLEKTLAEGLEVITRRGVETAVIVPVAQWETLRRAARPNLKELPLAIRPASPPTCALTRTRRR